MSPSGFRLSKNKSGYWRVEFTDLKGRRRRISTGVKDETTANARAVDLINQEFGNIDEPTLVHFDGRDPKRFLRSFFDDLRSSGRSDGTIDYYLRLLSFMLNCVTPAQFTCLNRSDVLIIKHYLANEYERERPCVWASPAGGASGDAPAVRDRGEVGVP